MTIKKTPQKGARGTHVKLKNARKFSNSSQQWLQRQLNDPYVAAAKKDGWRSRAAYKLLELDAKFKILKPGQRIIDLGAAPGGWTQVAVKVSGAQDTKKGAQVVGIDILPMEPVPGATTLQADFTEDSALTLLMDHIGGPVDVVLSDMAAGTVGHPQTDHLRIMMLAEMALDFAMDVLKPNGVFLCKVRQGGTEKELLDTLKQNFKTVKHAKPPASRAESSETYVIALGFKGKKA